MTKFFAADRAAGPETRSRRRAPAFWNTDGLLARALSPLSGVVAAITARRVARPGWTASVPVVCCGNATVGGAGKTTLALDLALRLTARGIAVHVLLRGYGGSARGPRRVLPGDEAAVTGDEALLLATLAPTWTGADRAASARAAIEAGAQMLLMDDGLQNPSLTKTMSLLVVDGATGFGNGRVLPAGPLREPVAAAAARCRPRCDRPGHRRRAGLVAAEPSGVARAPQARRDSCRSGGPPRAGFRRHRAARQVFYGIGTIWGRARGPAPVRGSSRVHVSRTRSSDRRGESVGCDAVTTPKDAVRLPRDYAAHVVGVRLAWENEAEIEALLDGLAIG